MATVKTNPKPGNFPSVTIEDDVVYLALDHPRCVTEFTQCLKKLLPRTQGSITVDCSRVNRIFPNACAPIASIISFVSGIGPNRLTFESVGPGIERTRMLMPSVATEAELRKADRVWNRVWCFEDHIQAHLILEYASREIQESSVWPSGVIDAFAWCVYEMMGNVLDHAQTGKGFFMYQKHADRIVICICDQGIGIYKSLKDTRHAPTTEIDAITKSLQQGVTRTLENQGMGLWGLRRIIQGNESIMSVRSGGSALVIEGALTTSFERLPCLHEPYKGTIIDFQLIGEDEIDVNSAVGAQDFRAPAVEGVKESNAQVTVSVAAAAHGTGSRQAGHRFRNLVLNQIESSGSRVIIDFEGVNIVSSSFADEFIGKLVNELGFVGFNQSIQISKANKLIQGILHDQISRRMSRGTF